APRGRARLDELRLCLVTDRSQTRGRDLVEVVATCVTAGLPAVQVREKDLAVAELGALCRRMRALRPRPFLIVNDRIDVALAGGITPGRVAEVRRAGAGGVAVISAILAADDPATMTRRFLDALGRQRDWPPGESHGATRHVTRPPTPST